MIIKEVMILCIRELLNQLIMLYAIIGNDDNFD